jgi:hypothetical protein
MSTVKAESASEEEVEDMMRRMYTFMPDLHVITPRKPYREMSNEREESYDDHIN